MFHVEWPWEAGPGLTVLALGLIGPVATVVLPVTLLALREALPVVALEGTGRAAWGAQGLSRGSRASSEATGSWAATPAPTPATLTAALLIAAILTVPHGVTDPEQGLAELVPARELVGGIALWRGGEAAGCQAHSVLSHSPRPWGSHPARSWRLTHGLQRIGTTPTPTSGLPARGRSQKPGTERAEDARGLTAVELITVVSAVGPAVTAKFLPDTPPRVTHETARARCRQRAGLKSTATPITSTAGFPTLWPATLGTRGDLPAQPPVQGSEAAAGGPLSCGKGFLQPVGQPERVGKALVVVPFWPP